MKNIKNVEVAINDFAMHLIIFIFRNGLEYKNADRRKKQWGKEDKPKEEAVSESVFTYLTI